MKADDALVNKVARAIALSRLGSLVGKVTSEKREEWVRRWAALDADIARVAIEAIPEPDGWQPIETAPDDLAYALLYWPHWSGRPVVGYRDSLGTWRATEVISSGPGPTHWRPLPNPPTDP